MTSEYKYNDIVMNRIVTRLHCGDTIKIAEKDEQRADPVMRKYTIETVYKFIAIGMCGKRKRVFSIGDLVMMGIEPSEVYYEDNRERLAYN